MWRDASRLVANSHAIDELTLLYFSVIEGHHGWGAEWFMDQALRRIGITVLPVDYRARRFRLVPALRRIKSCNAVLLQRGDAFPLPVIRALPKPRVLWASELVARCRDQDRLLRAGLFDHVFLRTSACIDAVTSAGWLRANQCSVLLSAFDPTFHRPLGLDRDIDVLFVGGVTPRRARALDQLRRHVSVHQSHVYGEDMVRLINRAKIVLNIHAEGALDVETRVFETLGCGALLVSERLACDSPFGPDCLIEVNSWCDLPDVINRLLQDEPLRQRIADQGYREALRQHTMLDRARQIVRVLQSLPGVDTRARITVDAPGLQLYGFMEPVLRLASGVRHVLGRVRAGRRRDRHLPVSSDPPGPSAWGD